MNAPKAAVAAGGIHGIGMDLVKVERMQKLLDRHGKRVLLKLLAPAELREVRARANTARGLAMCWAAKEACVKALGTGFSGIGFKEVGVVREANGRPRLIFSRAMQARLRREGVGATHVSLTDEDGLAGAYVILERKPG